MTIPFNQPLSQKPLGWSVLLTFCTCLWATTQFGCVRPCEALKERAQSCGHQTGGYTHPRDSTCRNLRTEMGPETFDPYASCVLQSSCDNKEQEQSCYESHITSQTQEPCTQYRLWVARCGLEPTGLAADCSNLSFSLGSAAFSNWAECVTQQGCPVADEDRHSMCQLFIPSAALTLLDSCTQIANWSAACGEQEFGGFTIDETNITECIAQSQPFTIESHQTYTTCMTNLKCDQIINRIDCLLLLRVTDRSQIQSQCAELIEFTEACNSFVGGGTIDNCVATFPRFEAESFQSYIDCIKSYPCGSIETLGACGPLLKVQ